MKAQRGFVLKVPATDRGRVFIEDLKDYLNTDTYTLGKLRYSGKRVTSFGGHTRKDDAKVIRVYLKDKRQPHNIAHNLQELANEVERFRYKAQVAEKKLEDIKVYIKRIV